MCGIFGYIGTQDAISICCEGLALLEYRGYDSTGIAGVNQGKISFRKKAGKLSSLRKILDLEPLDFAIAHTRWATHGGVSDENAHPHLDPTQSFALIHNGIIENYHSLKEELLKEGYLFSSQTDSEVIVQMIAKNYHGDLLDAVNQTIKRLEGSFAFLVIHKDHHEIIATAHGCPLAIGIDEKEEEVLLSSDASAFFGKNYRVFFLENKEIAKVQKGKISIFSEEKIPKKKIERILQNTQKAPTKEGFSHFMLKEIFEQPQAIRNAMQNRYQGSLFFEELGVSSSFFQDIERVWIVGCGTSSHAGSLATLFLEDLTGLFSFCDIASEAQYRKTVSPDKTLFLAISQSGETADTLSALRKAKKEGFRTLSLCNVEHSTMVREADASLFLKAGIEVSVCSTKAFTSQLTMLYLFSLYLGRIRNYLSVEEERNYFQELSLIPSALEKVLEQHKKIEGIAKCYAKYDHFFFMGRRYMYPTAVEAALKLKEISYVNANGYAAGELKHGPIALLDQNFPVVAFAGSRSTEEKFFSNLMEIKARKAPLLVFAFDSMKKIETVADHVIYLPETLDLLSSFTSTIASQLFAYYIAKERGCEIDQPRNLAKSVTVE